MRESIPASNPKDAVHAEPQVIKDLECKPKPHTIAVDQIPCSGCAPKIKDSSIDNVIVPQTADTVGSPKTAVAKAVKGKADVIPKELNDDLKID